MFVKTRRSGFRTILAAAIAVGASTAPASVTRQSVPHAASGASAPAVQAAQSDPVARRQLESRSEIAVASNLRFEQNAGQADAAVQFLARGDDETILVREESIIVVRGRSSFSVTLAETARPARFDGSKPFSGSTNYFIGSNPASWRTGIATYREVIGRDAYPGIDIAWTGRRAGLGLDLTIAGDADPSDVVLEFSGAARLEETADGDLVVWSSAGSSLIGKPMIRDESRPSPSPGRFRVLSSARVAIDREDAALPPNVDRTRVEYLACIGGVGGSQVGLGVAVDSEGCSYVAGDTSSADFPVTPGAFQTSLQPGAASACFVAKVDATGTDLIYASYFGGTGTIQATGLAVDETGASYLVGSTRSTDLPIVNGFQSSLPGINDVFLARLDPSGSHLDYATYLGGTNSDFPYAIASAGGGRVWICGYTSGTFPTTPGAYLNALDPSINYGHVAFATVVDTNLAGAASVPYSTLFVAGTNATALSVAVDPGDPSGPAYVAGVCGFGLPTTSGAWASETVASDSSFFLMLDPGKAGSEGLVYCSYVSPIPCSVLSIAAHDGLAYIGGLVSRAEFPTTPDAVRPVWQGQTTFDVTDGFLVVVDPKLPGSSALRYGTFLGGSHVDRVGSVAVDSAGSAWLTGYTSSADFPRSPDAFGRAGGFSDAYVTCTSPKIAGPAGLLFSSHLGGTNSDIGSAIALDALGGVYVTGVIGSESITAAPTFAPLIPSLGVLGPGRSSAYVLKLQAPTADLALSAASFEPYAVPRGGRSTARYDVANEGPGTARAVELVVDIPTGAALVSVRDSAGNVTLPPASTGSVRIWVGDISRASSSSIWLEFDIASAAEDVLVFHANAVGAIVDTDAGDSSRFQDVLVVNYPEIRRIKAVGGPDGSIEIIVRGTNFRSGATVYVSADLAPWPRTRLTGTRKLRLSGPGLRERFPSGVPVALRVVNLDGSFVAGEFTR